MLIYDIEIINCIPEKDKPNNPDYTYCEGWHDHENMGISVIGAYFRGNYIVFTDAPCTGDFYWYSLTNFLPFVQAIQLTGEKIGGFNNRNFDDKVIRLVANRAFTSNFDLLQEIRLAAYGSTEWSDQPKGSCYSLDAIAKANGMAKTGHGALAPQQWQDGKYDEVIAYCLNDCRITYDILCLFLKGELVDPNTGKKLQIHL